jgi:hypothetical protein
MNRRKALHPGQGIYFTAVVPGECLQMGAEGWLAQRGQFALVHLWSLYSLAHGSSAGIFGVPFRLGTGSR